MDYRLFVAFPLGILIGLVSGIVLLLLLYDVARPNQGRRSWMERIFGRKRVSGLNLTTKVLSLPFFWFGGPWLSTYLIRDLVWKDLLPPYVLGMTVTIILVIGYPLFRFILKTAGNMRW